MAMLDPYFEIVYHCGMAKTMISETKMSDLARRCVTEALREILSDPDAGLALRADFVRGLKRSVRASKKGQYKALSAVLD